MERFIYVMCKTLLCPGLSGGVWNLHQHPSHRQPGDTEYYCAWYPHSDPANEYSVLELPRHEAVPVHLEDEAQAELLTNVLMAFVQDGAITLEELQGIVGAVQSGAGSEILVADMIPDSWAPYVFDTRAAANAAGFLV